MSDETRGDVAAAAGAAACTACFGDIVSSNPEVSAAVGTLVALTLRVVLPDMVRAAARALSTWWQKRGGDGDGSPPPPVTVQPGPGRPARQRRAVTPHLVTAEA